MPHWIAKNPFGPETELPFDSEDFLCHETQGSTHVTVYHDNRAYSRPMYRIRYLLKQKRIGGPLHADLQASHLCVNVGGQARPCCNPLHTTPETDLDNKKRKKCVGWIFIHPHNGNPGGFWYPTCTCALPSCFRFVPKTLMSPQLVIDDVRLDML